MAYLDSRLDTLHLNSLGFPDTVFLHVHQVTRFTVKTPVHLALDVLGPHAGQDTDGASTSVLGQCPRNNLHGVSHGLVRPLLNTFNRLGQLAQLNGNSHLQSTTARGQARVENDVPGNGHGVLQVTLNLVKDVLGGTPQKDGTGLGCLAFSHESEVFVTDLLDLEQATLGTDVGLLEVVDAVHNCRASGSGNTVVVSLSHTAEGCDVGPGEEVLGEV